MDTTNEFEGYWTVEEASRFLTCKQPIDLKILQQLGRDASLFCRIRNIPRKDKPVVGKRWPTERAYSLPVILEVFKLNPDVRNFLPTLTT